MENATLVQDMERCQKELHKLGRANQVTFDPSKESMHILKLHGGKASSFRLLGILFDNALSMKDAVLETVEEATWKMAAILRTGIFVHGR